MTQATKAVPAKTAPAKKASTPAQVFDFSAITVQDSARPTRTAGRVAAPVPQPILDAVTASWAARERRTNGRYIGKGKTLPNVPGTAVKTAMAHLRRAGVKIGVGVGMQIQDRSGNKVAVKDVNDRATYALVFAAQTAKETKKNVKPA